MEPWFWAIIGIGGLLLAILVVWCFCEISSRHKRKRHRKEFDAKVYEHEKERAEKTLAALQNANLARAGAATYCNHGYSVPGPQDGVACVPVSQAAGGCPACYAAGYYQLQSDAQQRQMLPRGDDGPQLQSPYRSSSPQPAYAGTQMQQYQQPQQYQQLQQYQQPDSYAQYPQGDGYSGSSVVAVSQAGGYGYGGGYAQPTAQTADGRTRIRLAQIDAEIPNTPPPVAPPGFCTVPMVLENV